MSAADVVKKVFSFSPERPLANRVICTAMMTSVVVCWSIATWVTWSQGQGLTNVMSLSVYEYGFYSLINIILIELMFIGMLMVVHFDRRSRIENARYAVRATMFLLIGAVLSCFIVNGLAFVEGFYLFQFACLVSYQVFNDPNLSFNAPWYNPFSRKARAEAKADRLSSRGRYMPMNFFNLFWVFMIGCVGGVALETWYRLMEVGILEDRAGLLWGPFSPIYGFGCVIVTIVLNSFWNKNPAIIFGVSAVIGAGFEFFVSWYMEVAFGICAWDYSTAFLNLDGRTDLAHALAWGAVGFVWIRFGLPVTMRLVGAIKLKWRANITSLAFATMLVDGAMTLMALDAWSMRTSGTEPSDDVQMFYAEHFDDEWMANRFQTMSVSKTDSVRLHLFER